MLSRVDLLENLFIEFDDEELDAGHTYLIDHESAEEIVAQEKNVLLRDGGEGVLVPLSRIQSALETGCIIDYRDPPRP